MYALIVVFSFVVGIISGLLGVGGGILIVPFLIFLCRYPTKNSAGVVSFIVIFSSLFGVAGHLTTGALDLPLILGTGVAVVIGATIGSRSMVKLPGRYIKVGFGVILWVFAIQLILKLTDLLEFFLLPSAEFVRLNLVISTFFPYIYVRWHDRRAWESSWTDMQETWSLSTSLRGRSLSNPPPSISSGSTLADGVSASGC